MRFILVILLLACSKLLEAQFYASGTNPSRLKWSQIKTPVARIVFEDGFTSEATRLAHFIDSVAPWVAGTLGHFPRRVNLLVHNHSAISNGFVSWAPRRTEFFSTPHQNLGPVDWLEHLTIHEYRHVVQLDKLNQGFTRGLSFFIGQQAVGAVAGLHLPMWFLEGDAVITETTLTRGGRGRSFGFTMELKAQLVEKGKFSFDRAYMGSYREQVPDFYQMGYMLTGLARREHGSSLWKNAIENSGRNSWWLTPFSDVIRRQTGFNKRELYNHLFSNLETAWRKEHEISSYTSHLPVAVPWGDDYRRYMHPVAINDSTLISTLRGPGIRSSIVSIDIASGQTRTLAFTGRTRDTDPISANRFLVAWSEQQNHPRWENESWSIIRLHCLVTGETRNLTRETMLHAPALHPYKNIVAAVETTREYRFYLTFVDAESGKIIKRVPTPNNNFILTPSWNLNGDNLVCVLLSGNGKVLYTYCMNNNQWTRVTEPNFEEPRHPVQSGQYIWYTAEGPFSDEIFRVNTTSGEVIQVTSSPFGAMYPTITPVGKQLIYSAYSSNGFRPVLHSGQDAGVENDSHQISFVEQLASDLTRQDTIRLPMLHEDSSHEVKGYSEWNIVNLHSWAPMFVDFDRESLHSGFSLMSQNLLNTTIVTAGFNADPAAIHEKYRLDITYRGFFPLVDISARAGNTNFSRNGIFTNNTDTFRINTDQQIYHVYLSGGLRLPLNFNRGEFGRLVMPSVALTHQHRSEVTYPRELYSIQNGLLVPRGISDTGTVPGVNFFGMEYSFYAHNLRSGTSRDVGTRWGQMLRVTYRHTPWGNRDNGSILGISTRHFIPGIAPYHSISISNDYQIKKPGDRSTNQGDYISRNMHGNLISAPRGYGSIFNDEMWVARATYMIPLLTPDFSIGGIAYIKRLRLNLFHDLAMASYTLTRIENLSSEVNENWFGSTGVELHADTHFLRFILPFSIGYRAGILTPERRFFNEFVLRSSFSNFLVR